MVWGPALVWLGTQYGPVVAKSIVAALSKSKNAGDRLAQVAPLIEAGTTAIDAFKRIFGQDFDAALTEALKAPRVDWSYEAGRTDYIRVDVFDGEVRSVDQTLRDELNINLDRLARLYGGKGAEVQNYFRGVFREWMNRYRSIIVESDDSRKTFETIESLLDGHRKSFADGFKLLQQAGLGTLGALLVIQAGLVATSTGVGLFAVISTWLLGIPVVQVGALAVGGVVLFALSRVKLSASNAMSMSVATAYKLLDRQRGKL